MSGAVWSKAEIEALIAAEDFGRLEIPLPHSLVTSGFDTRRLMDSILPPDLSGKSVLDAVSGCGALCFEALKRGASRVVGYDAERENLRKSRLLAGILGSSASFELRDIVRHPPDEIFDYVICLDTIYHLRSPLAVLDRLIAASRERVIVDLAPRRRFLPVMGGRLPLVRIGRNGSTGKHRRPKFRFTESAARTLLMRHRSAIAGVETVTPEGLPIAIAHKRRIEHLIVVAGPVAAGKSRFCEALQAGRLPAISQQLGLELGASLPAFTTSLYGHRPASHVQTALLHYGFLRPYGRRARVHFRDEALDILGAAQKLTFVTVWATPEALVERITKGEIDAVAEPSDRHLSLREEYRDPRRVREHYERWIAFTRDFMATHWMAVEDGPDMRLVSLDEWRQAYAPRECVPA